MIFRRKKTKALRKFQERIARNIRDNSPKDASEVVIRSIGWNLLRRLFESKKDVNESDERVIRKVEAPDSWPPPHKVKWDKIGN